MTFDDLFQNKKGTKERAKPVLLVCGIFTPPENSLVEFVTGHSLADFIKLGTESELGESPRCYMIVEEEDSELIACASAYPDLFDFDMFVLTGIIGCDYTSGFSQATHSLQRTPYSTLISNLVAAAEDARLNPKQVGDDTYDKEQKQIVSKTGNIRQMTAFESPHLAPDEILPDDFSEQTAD